MLRSVLSVMGLPRSPPGYAPRAPVVSLVIGGNDSDTLLLLHCDGVEGSTTIVNSAVGGAEKFLTAQGTAKITIVGPKFGEGSLLCDGGGAHVTCEPSSDFNFTGDFCVDFWAHVKLSSCHPFLMAWWQSESNFLAIEHVMTRGTEVIYRVRLRESGVDRFILMGAYSPGVGDWHHFALVRYGDDVTWYVDGVAQDTEEYVDAIDLSLITLYVGMSLRAGWVDLRALDGNIDEYRISRVARFTENFTPYQNAYSATFRTRDAGLASILASFRSRDAGTNSVSYLPYRTQDAGLNGLMAYYRSRDAGVNDINVGFRTRDAGQHGVAAVPVTSYRARDAGLANLANAFRARDAGQNNMAAAYRTRDAGVSNTIATYRTRDAGVSTTRRTYRTRDAGRYNMLGIPGYLLYHALGSPPNPDVDAPVASSPTLPIIYGMTGAGKHYLILRRQNIWNLKTRNKYTPTIVELDGSNVQLAPRPSNRFVQSFAAGPAGTLVITARYAYGADGIYQADQWLVYFRSDGVTPNIGNTTPVVVDMQKADGIAKLLWSSAALTEGQQGRMFVLTRRSLSSPRDSEHDGSVQIQTATLLGPAPIQPGLFGLFGGGLQNIG